MGPDEKEVKKFVMCPINPDGSFGESIELEKLKSICLDDEEVFVETVTKPLTYIHGSFTMSYEGLVPHKKISRKTFKKWLMAHGFSRNYAEWLCRFISTYAGEVSYQSTYVKHYFEVVFKNKEFQKSWTK